MTTPSLASVPGTSEQPARDDGPPRVLPSLTGLRFVAAFAVFCFHVTQVTSFIPGAGQVSPIADTPAAYTLEWVFGRAGFFGVGFFFVLSGFVLAWGWAGGQRIAFWRRRVVKIVPNHVVVWAMAMVLFAASISEWGPALLNLLLLNAFSPSTVFVPVNPPSWTLGAEMLFYLLFPLVAGPLLRLSSRALVATAGVLVALVVAVPVLATTLLPGPPPGGYAPVSEIQLWFAYMFPVARLPEFLIGSVLAVLVRRGWRPHIPVPLAWVSLLVAYAAATLVLPFHLTFAVAGLLPICLLLLAYAVRDSEGRPSAFRRPTWRRLGEISYGFYLCQAITVFYVRDVTGSPTYGPAGALATVVALLALTLLGGGILWWAVENPCMRRWSRRRPAA